MHDGKGCIHILKEMRDASLGQIMAEEFALAEEDWRCQGRFDSVAVPENRAVRLDLLGLPQFRDDLGSVSLRTLLLRGLVVSTSERCLLAVLTRIGAITANLYRGFSMAP